MTRPSSLTRRIAADRPQATGHPEAGFSLLEVMVGLVVFAVMLLTAMMVFALGSRVSTQTSLMDRATAVAEGHLETLRAMGYDAVKAAYQAVPPPGPETAEDDHFSITTQVTEVADPGGADLRLLEVVVTVTWDDRGESLSLTIESLIAGR